MVLSIHRVPKGQGKDSAVVFSASPIPFYFNRVVGRTVEVSVPTNTNKYESTTVIIRKQPLSPGGPS